MMSSAASAGPLNELLWQPLVRQKGEIIPVAAIKQQLPFLENETQGICLMEIRRGNDPLANDRFLRRFASSFKECQDRYNQDSKGQEACPASAYHYYFSLAVPVVQAAGKNQRNGNRVVYRDVSVDLGERPCRYKAWLDNHPDFRKAIFWERDENVTFTPLVTGVPDAPEIILYYLMSISGAYDYRRYNSSNETVTSQDVLLTSAEKKRFFEFLRRLHRRQDLGLNDYAQPIVSDRPREQCQNWQNPVYEDNPGGRAHVEGQDEPFLLLHRGRCLDRVHDQTPQEMVEGHRLAWIAKAAFSLYLEMNQRIPWSLGNYSLQKLRLLFPEFVWAQNYAPRALDPGRVGPGMTFYDGTKILRFFEEQHLMGGTQRETLLRYLALLQDGNAEGRYAMKHASSGGCVSVDSALADAREQAGQPVTWRDVVPPGEEARWENVPWGDLSVSCDHPLEPGTEYDFSIYMNRSVDCGCPCFGKKALFALTFLNIPVDNRMFMIVSDNQVYQGHHYTVFHTDQGVYGLMHNDDILNPTLPPIIESKLLPERYFPLLYEVTPFAEQSEAIMEREICVSLLEYLPLRCEQNPLLEPFRPYAMGEGWQYNDAERNTPENFCGTFYYRQPLYGVYDENGQPRTESRSIELLPPADYQRLLEIIERSNRSCVGPEGDPAL